MSEQYQNQKFKQNLKRYEKLDASRHVDIKTYTSEIMSMQVAELQKNIYERSLAFLQWS